MNREEWLSTLRKRGWSDSDISKARFAWNAGNRAGKEECVDICIRLATENVEKNDAYCCAKAIRETIKNEPA